MTLFWVDITCNQHGGRVRVIDSFIYGEHVDTGVVEWRWASSRKTGGGKLDGGSGLREWFEPAPSHQTVREDFDDGIARVRLRCRRHGDVGMPWSEFISRVLDPCRENGVHQVPLSRIVADRTTRRPS